MFYHVENLTKQSTTPCVPWEFESGEISDKVRHTKTVRQQWYQNPETEHSFYTGYEALNPNARITTANPVRNCGALSADIDASYSEENLLRLIDRLSDMLKPVYYEKSLGGNWRLVWEFAELCRFPDDPELATAVLKELAIKFGIDDIDGMDMPSWLNPARMYANGGVWHKVERAKKIESSWLEGIIWNTTGKLAKKSKAKEVMLGRIEKLVRKKWPNFEWPEEFVEGSQGPSWWVEGSTSDKSAIVHASGCYTFSAHAEKSFFTWSDILGPSALEDDEREQIECATKDYYYDGQSYFGPRRNGGFQSEKVDVLRRRFVVTNGLNDKKKKGDPSTELDRALAFIEDVHRVDAAAPFIFRPQGLTDFNGNTYLNTCSVKPIEPAEGKQEWGENGNFPFISKWFSLIFRNEEQLSHYISWIHIFYEAALRGVAVQGQAGFFGGGAGIGKSLKSHKVFGPLMGGCADASKYLMGNDNFGADLYRSPVWCSDDDTMTGNDATIMKFTNMVKRAVANREMQFHEKYRQQCMVDFAGRQVVTFNLDAWSKTIIPTLEASTKDKVNFYRLISNDESLPEGHPEKLPAGFFPPQTELEAILKNELAYFARYVLDYVIPEKFLGDTRFGIKAYHDESLVESSYHNSGSASAQEIVHDFMTEHNKVAETHEWSGTASQLLRGMAAFAGFESVTKGVTSKAMNKHLASLQSFPGLEIKSQTHPVSRLRIWTIKIKE
jgi:hypothetical protein